jgi:hypothetical protein
MSLTNSDVQEHATFLCDLMRLAATNGGTVRTASEEPPRFITIEQAIEIELHAMLKWERDLHRRPPPARI